MDMTRFAQHIKVTVGATDAAQSLFYTLARVLVEHGVIDWKGCHCLSKGCTGEC